MTPIPTTSRERTRRPVLAVLLVLLLPTAACSGAGEDAASGAPDHVRAVVMPFLSFAPFHIAAREGYFAEQNLEVEFVRLPRIQELMTGLSRGDVDVSGGMLTTTVLNSIAAGANMRVVGALAHAAAGECAFIGAMARRQLADSGALDDPERLRELTWDADVLIPFGFWLEEIVRPHGLGLDDLNIVNLRDATAVESLLNGAIDVTLIGEPFLNALAVRPNEAILWKNISEITPDYQISNVIYGPGLLDDRPEVGERFAVAMLKAIRQYMEGKTPRNLEIVESATGLTSEQVASACWPAARADGRIPDGAFTAYQEWMLRRGLTDRVLDEDEFIDHRFMRFANAELSR